MNMALLPTPTTQNLAVFLLLSALLHAAISTPNTAVKSVLCNGESYGNGDPFAISLAYVLSELETVTPSQKGYDFHNISPYPNAFAYGHAACSRNLTSSECSVCLAAAKTAVISTCSGRIGARAELYDCTVRYEQYPFDD